jgi:phospholipid transport system transporter-binding protein
MLALPKVLTHTQARICLQGLCEAISALDAQATVIIDAQALLQFDTSALAVLLASRRAAQARGLPWSIHQLPAKLNDLAGLYGVRELLQTPS